MAYFFASSCTQLCLTLFCYSSILRIYSDCTKWTESNVELKHQNRELFRSRQSKMAQFQEISKLFGINFWLERKHDILDDYRTHNFRVANTFQLWLHVLHFSSKKINFDQTRINWYLFSSMTIFKKIDQICNVPQDLSTKLVTRPT